MAKGAIMLILDLDFPDPGLGVPVTTFEKEVEKIIDSGCVEAGLSRKGSGRIFNGNLVYELE